MKTSKSIRPDRLDARSCARSKVNDRFTRGARGDVFFAITVPGGKGDGRDFIANAIERGAAAIVVAAGGVELQTWRYLWAQNEESESTLGAIGNEWYNNIQADMFTVAVTGTNGKTSCSQWIARAPFERDALCCDRYSRCWYHREGHLSALSETGFATPDALQLQEKLADVYARGASCFGNRSFCRLDCTQGRLNGLHFDVAVFTNLTRDHLDYHRTMECSCRCQSDVVHRWPQLQTR